MSATTVKPPKGAAWREWPTKAQAEQRYRCTAQQLGALVRHGRLRRFKCDDRTIRFSPAELDAAFKVEPGDDDDDDDLDRELEPVQDPLLRALEDSNRTLLDLVKELKEERKEVLALFFKDPMNQVLKALEAALKQLSDDNAKLRDGWTEANAAREKLLSQEHERALLTDMVHGESARAEERMKMLRTYGPMVLQNLGLNAESQTVVELVQGLSPEAVEVVATILTPAQKALFEKLRGASKTGAAAPQPEQETPPS